MSVPMLDLRAQYGTIKSEIDAAVAEVFASQVFIGGPNVEGLEAEMAEYLGVASTVGVASGTDALLLSLKALGVQRGDEVITSDFSFFATGGAIANAGAKPVFVDIRPDTFNIDPAAIEAHITERTRAIVPVHLYGQCADMRTILDIAAKHDIPVVEDAAQAVGARCGERKAC
ncbi:MAG TPA: aminotransferase class I/II-fold pyridoxal phosphate-dependent enzyme, partial [Candidatus Hydrogenedentes bacterium]|nr:aminotransferase class I/II-fold pyridoxal phosphate-dependent enzyme [Candidatus Hydrogenedentota bacterium]